MASNAGCRGCAASGGHVGVQAYLMFGDETSLTMYAEAHAAANATMRLVGELGRRGWLVDVHMATGQLSRVWVSSLAAFWPGLQALAGTPLPSSEAVFLSSLCAL